MLLSVFFFCFLFFVSTLTLVFFVNTVFNFHSKRGKLRKHLVKSEALVCLALGYINLQVLVKHRTCVRLVRLARLEQVRS